MSERTGASLTGIDFADGAIALAQSLANDRAAPARFLIRDATSTGLPAGSAGSAGGVMCVDALMFLDPAAAAAEAARILKPGGRFVATAAESLAEPFTPTLVRDYRPVFERAGFTTVSHEEPVGHVDTQLALYQSILERTPALRAEMGPAAEVLLDEARSGSIRTEQNATRVRNIFFVAERIGGVSL